MTETRPASQEPTMHEIMYHSHRNAAGNLDRVGASCTCGWSHLSAIPAGIRDGAADAAHFTISAAIAHAQSYGNSHIPFPSF